MQADINIQHLLNRFSEFNINDLERFSQELNALISRKKAGDKNVQIAKLLSQHNQTILSKEKKLLYRALKDKEQANSISKEEQQTLLNIIEEAENLRNERLKLLIQIAQLRQISLPVLIQELGLNPVGNA